jgi:acetyl-CoA synthetase
MTGLRDITVPGARSWEEAYERFRFPAVDRYNIGADCLRAPAGAPALLVADAGDVRTVTFGELDERSARLAAGLRTLGVAPRDRVAVKLAQSVDMAVAILAALRVGAIVVPVSNVLGEEGVRHRLSSSEPRLIVAAGTGAEIGLAAEAGVPLVATRDDAPAPTLQGLVDAAPSASPEFASTRPDDPALLLYTSGTTGKSKGVLHGHRVLLGHHGVNWALERIRPDDVSYSPVDWAWAGGLFLGLLVPLAHGIPVVVFREQRFDAGRTLALLRDCGVSVGLFPPTMLRMLRQSGLVTPEVAAGLRLRCLVTGAEAVEPDLFMWAADELGVRVNNAYGQTEANALVGHSGVLGALDPGCLGRPYPGHRIAVLDDALQPLGPGEPGQLAVSADDAVCMLRYWGDAGATAAKVASGWLPTGDSAHFDDRGQLVFHGREDDLIKSGGYRIGPAEVEAALLLHPAVAECAVVGLPDPVRGQVVTAFIRLRDPDDESEALTDELTRQVRGSVGAHAYPRELNYVADLPRTTTGKVDRASLRRLHADAAAGGGTR